MDHWRDYSDLYADHCWMLWPLTFLDPCWLTLSVRGDPLI